ncbi:putative T7SS-secreted protein [Leifsonia sp. NPDC058292]|uniref:putative T7SS-secreted protein n=1 Tax=Leifsonia sp. NPDC058292 TaxID=3346428 RepID=UPI0036D983C6
MITGSSSVASVLPGNPSTISKALETVGAGIGPSRAVTNAWQSMSLPAWHGQAASRWGSFVPRETARTGKAPVAFNRAATAMLRYQNAFISARAEIEAAIEDAANADRATATATQTHADAIRIAQAAQAGSPGSVVPTFTDPGATRLLAAQSRAQTALTRFTQIGDEVAAEIRAAARETSGEKPGIEWWDQVVQFPGRFVEGVILQGVDTLVGVWDMLPIKYVFDDWFGDGKPWWEAYFVDLWGDIIGTIVEDPWGAVESMWGDFIAADHWDGYAGEGTGRVAANVLMMLLGGPGAARLLKGVKGLGSERALAAFRGAAVQSAEDIANGHAFGKHVIKRGEFPGVSTREQFIVLIKKTIKTGEVRQLQGDRAAFWKDGVVVLLDPQNADRGTAFRPKDGYDYFLNLK